MATSTPTTEPILADLPVEVIDPAEDNPRLAFGSDLGDLEELTDLIRAQGVLQRLVVCAPVEGRYRLVFGARRLEAAKRAGRTTVPVEVRDYDEAARIAAMSGENGGRQDLTPLQEAWAWYQALQRKGPDDKKLFSTRSLAERLGVSQSKISKYTSLFKLPDRVIEILKAGDLTVTEAIHLELLAKHPDRIEAALAAYQEQRDKDMQLAVQTELNDLDREAKVAAATKKLKAAGTPIAATDWRETGGRKLGAGYHQLDVSPQEHADLPCHAAIVTHHGEVAFVCTDPSKHQPADPAPAPTGQPDPAAAAAGSDEPPGPASADQPATATTGSPPPAAPPGSAPAAQLDVDPEPSPEEQEAKARMEAAREAARLEAAAREQAARQLAADLEEAYHGRDEALRTLLATRVSAAEAGRLFPKFLLNLAFAQLGYDDGFLRHALSLDEPAEGDGESPVLAFADRNDDALRRTGVAIVAEHAEGLIAQMAPEELDLTHPVLAVYLDFLATAAAWKPTAIERAGLGEDPPNGDADAAGQDPDAEAATAEQAAALAAAG
jgi:ParB family chromosome partitioning protein